MAKRVSQRFFICISKVPRLPSLFTVNQTELMPNWTESLNQTSQGLVRGLVIENGEIKRKRQPKPQYRTHRIISSSSTRLSGRATGWKKSLNETGAGLLKGIGVKLDKNSDDFEMPLNVNHPQ